MTANCAIYKTDGGDTQVFGEGAEIRHEDGVGDANASSAIVAEELGALMHHTKLTFDDFAITMTDATTNGCHGSAKLYDFPAGLLEIHRVKVDLTTLASANITTTAALVGSLGTAAVGTGNATLTGTEADVVPSITGTLSSRAGTLEAVTAPAVSNDIAALTDNTGGTADDTLATIGATNSGDVSAAIKNNFADLAAKVNALLARTVSRIILDGTGTAKDLYLNLAVPDAGSSGNGTVTINGTIDIFWTNYGDL